MRNREEDRQRWQDPEFNKWLDDAISDAGHSVWDSVPDIGSAWNGWDAAKAALGYYCEACGGSGEEIHVSYHGPDSFERLGHCSACNGDGRSSEALKASNHRLEEIRRELSAGHAREWDLRWQVKAAKESRARVVESNKALRAEIEALRKEKSSPCDGCFMVEVEDLRKDAERYRAMRSHATTWRSALPGHPPVSEADYDAECDAVFVPRNPAK